MSFFSEWADGVLSDMETDSFLREARLKQLYALAEKGEQMAKFLYPQAVADAFREYVNAILTMFTLMDDELALPVAKAVGDEIKRPGAVDSNEGGV